MSRVILVFNAGSSTLKFALYQVAATDPVMMAQGIIDQGFSPARVRIHSASQEIVFDGHLSASSIKAPFIWIIELLTRHFADAELIAAGHRVVHGGHRFSAPTLLNNTVVRHLADLSHLAPLHQAHNLEAIDSLADTMPALPQVACFDTSFHCTNSAITTQFALPRALTETGIQRYGFHGLSYEYIAGRLPEYAGHLAMGRVIVAHLGNGASLCGLYQGHSVATTMGFSALDGLPMAERCGNLDPGVILYLMKEHGMDYEALSDLLYHQSGLLGVSGISGDMRTLEADGSAAAQRAIDLFVYRIHREIGSLAAALGGLDVLVFTGGIGEHSALIRALVCKQANWLGVVIDDEANAQGAASFHAANSSVKVYTVPTDENRVIARATQRLVCQSSNQEA